MIWYSLLISIGLLLLISLLFLFSTAQVTIAYRTRVNKDHIAIELRLWRGLLRFRRHIPLGSLTLPTPPTADSEEAPRERENNKSFWDKLFGRKQRKLRGKRKLHHRRKRKRTSLLYTMLQKWKRVHNLHEILKRFLLKVKLEKFIWRTALGTGDAHDTGMLIGIGWSVKSTMAGLLSTYLTLRTLPQIEVKPLYHRAEVNIQFECMVRFRIGDAIVAGIRLFLTSGRSEGLWRSTPFKA